MQNEPGSIGASELVRQVVGERLGSVLLQEQVVEREHVRRSWQSHILVLSSQDLQSLLNETLHEVVVPNEYMFDVGLVDKVRNRRRRVSGRNREDYVIRAHDADFSDVVRHDVYPRLSSTLDRGIKSIERTYRTARRYL